MFVEEASNAEELQRFFFCLNYPDRLSQICFSLLVFATDFFVFFLRQVDLRSLHLLCAVATQGNPEGNGDYVKRYKLQHSSDGVTWTVYQENGNSVS